MIISGAVTTNKSDEQVVRSSALGRDTFLKLLVAQLQYQDPLSPMENTEFTAQMAQFSSLEELYNINDNLKNIELYEASLNNSQAVSFIGKEIEANGDTMQIRDETQDDMRYDLTQNATQVHISIYDSVGNLVRDINKGAQGVGSYVESWDGMDNEGNKLPDGLYAYSMSAMDENGSAVNISSYVTGRVTGVAFDNSIVYLMVGDKKVNVSDVIRIKEVTQ